MLRTLSFTAFARGRSQRVTQSRKAPHRDLLLEHHEFPGPYTIKAFGPAQGTFRSQVEQAVRDCGCELRASLRERASRGGNRICVTIEWQAQSVDEVTELYEALHRIESLALIL